MMSCKLSETELLSVMEAFIAALDDDPNKAIQAIAAALPGARTDEREAARKRVREAVETLRKQRFGEHINWADLLIWGIEAYLNVDISDFPNG